MSTENTINTIITLPNHQIDIARWSDSKGVDIACLLPVAQQAIGIAMIVSTIAQFVFKDLWVALSHYLTAPAVGPEGESKALQKMKEHKFTFEKMNENHGNLNNELTTLNFTKLEKESDLTNKMNEIEMLNSEVELFKTNSKNAQDILDTEIKTIKETIAQNEKDLDETNLNITKTKDLIKENLTEKEKAQKNEVIKANIYKQVEGLHKTELRLEKIKDETVVTVSPRKKPEPTKIELLQEEIDKSQKKIDVFESIFDSKDIEATILYDKIPTFDPHVDGVQIDKIEKSIESIDIELDKIENQIKKEKTYIEKIKKEIICIKEQEIKDLEKEEILKNTVLSEQAENLFKGLEESKKNKFKEPTPQDKLDDWKTAQKEVKELGTKDHHLQRDLRSDNSKSEHLTKELLANKVLLENSNTIAQKEKDAVQTKISEFEQQVQTLNSEKTGLELEISQLNDEIEIKTTELDFHDLTANDKAIYACQVAVATAWKDISDFVLGLGRATIILGTILSYKNLKNKNYPA